MPEIKEESSKEELDSEEDTENQVHMAKNVNAIDIQNGIENAVEKKNQ